MHLTGSACLYSIRTKGHHIETCFHVFVMIALEPCSAILMHYCNMQWMAIIMYIHC